MDSEGGVESPEKPKSDVVAETSSSPSVMRSEVISSKEVEKDMSVVNDEKVQGDNVKPSPTEPSSTEPEEKSSCVVVAEDTPESSARRVDDGDVKKTENEKVKDEMEVDEHESSVVVESSDKTDSTIEISDVKMDFVENSDMKDVKTELKSPTTGKSFVVPLSSPRIPSLEQGVDSNQNKALHVLAKEILPTVPPPPELTKEVVHGNSDELNKLLASTKSISSALAKPIVNVEGIILNCNQKRKFHNGCSNGNCTSNSDELVISKKAAMLYFRFNTSYKKVHKICKVCNEEAENFLKNTVNALKNEQNVFAFKPKPQGMEGDVIEVNEDEEEDDPAEVRRLEAEDKEVFEFPTSLDDIIANVMERLNLTSQVHKCEQTVAMESANFERDFASLDKQISFVEKQVGETKKMYDKVTGYYQPIPVIMEEIDISVTGVIVKSRAENDHLQHIPNLPTLPAGLFRKKESSDGEAYHTRPRKAKENRPHYADDGEIMEVETPSALEKKPCPLARAPKEIPRVVPAAGSIVYAQNRTLLHFWLKTTIVEVVEVGPGKSPEFIVRFEKRQGPGGGGVKRVTAKQIAYNIPCPFILVVGTRIIAKFHDELKTEPIGDGQFYAGIVAEQPTGPNGYRYLIFFDDGYAQYVDNRYVLLVYEFSREVWSDVHPDSSEFIKTYINKYPERPMVRMSIGQVVTTEWNGRWWVARVVELDCSLVKMKFENDERCEWIYRGSTRLSPLFEKQTRQRQKKTARRTTSAPIYNKNQARIEYNYGDEDLVPSQDKTKPVKPIARKSTSGGVPHALEKALEKEYGNIRRLARLDYGEFEGTIIKRSILPEAPVTQEHIPHSCDNSCVHVYDETNKEYKKMNPLAIPLNLGFTREIAKNPRRSVFYRAPCGLRIRDMEEMYDYLSQTKCQVPIDHFCFDLAVDCLNEFRHSRQHSFLPDLTYGKEAAPVQVVNAFDYEYPPYVEYSSQRIAGAGVHLNTEDDFLVGCECEDDCRDKAKCRCWQTTFSGISFTKLNNPDFPTKGYEYRRLRDHIVSGIYECNPKCKCSKTCCNRVAQNGLKVPLQVFKTAAKGWGIRPLFDVPEGAFICIYAGQVLTDAGANEDGQQFGDEYLAELDYIESIENVKADYESDVTDIETEEPGTCSKKRKIKKGKGDDESDDEVDYHAGDSSYRGPKPSTNERTVSTRGKNNGKNGSESSKNSDSDDDGEGGARPRSHFNADVKTCKKVTNRRPLRAYFGENEECYIMDAKTTGNIGRYLNHSCQPNVFVQNVFVDTHDLRFPWVSFFASKHIRAGSELTWDYNYEIGSVPNKVLFCYCGSPDCRGRLL